MSLMNWLRKLVSGAAKKDGRRSRSRWPHYQLCLEILEARETPATDITISTAATAGGTFVQTGGVETFTPNSLANTATVNNGDIETFLNMGDFVIINTTNATGLNPGNITEAAGATIQKTAGAAATLELDATNNLAISQSITSTLKALEVDLTWGGAGTVSAGITTNGGDFLAGPQGGATASTFDNTGGVIATATGFISINTDTVLTVGANLTGNGVSFEGQGITELSGVTVDAGNNIIRFQGLGAPINLGSGTLTTTSTGNALGDIQIDEASTLTLGNVIDGTAGSALVASGGTGAVTQNAGTTINISNVSIDTNSTINLPNNNAVSTLAALADGAIIFNDGSTDLTVGTVIAGLGGIQSLGNNVTLTTTGRLTIGQGAGESIVAGLATLDLDVGGITEVAAPTPSIIVGGSLRLQGTGTFTLPNANSITSTLAADTTGAILFLNSLALTVGQVLTTAGITTGGSNVTLCTTAGDLILANSINAGAATVLLDTAGNLTQTGGFVTANTLGLRANGNISMVDANAASNLAFQAGGTFVYNSAGPFVFITLPAAACFRGANGGSGGDITICQAAGTLTVNLPLNAGAIGTIRLQSGGDVAQTANGILTAANLGVVADGNIDLCVTSPSPTPNSITGQFAANASGGPVGSHVFFLDADGFTVGSVTPSSCFAGAIGASSNNGDIDLVSEAGPLFVAAQIKAGTGTVRLNSGAFVLEQIGLVAVAGVAIAGGGNGYTVGDVLTLLGGTFTVPAQLMVTSIGAGGSVTGVTVLQMGSYSFLPANPVSVNGGTGLNATFNVSSINILQVGVISAANLAVVAKGNINLCIPGVPNQVSGTFAADASGGPAGSSVMFLDAPGFIVGAVAGDVCASGATGVRTNNGDVDLVSTNGPITLTQFINTTPTPVAALTATVRLNSGGAVTQTPAGSGGVGAITALNLAVVAAGNVDLCQVANDVTGNLAATDTAAGAFVRFLDTPGFTVNTVAGDVCAAGATGVTTNNGDVDLVSTNGPITLTQLINTTPTPVAALTATVRLNSGGAVSQSPAGLGGVGAITALNLAVVAAGNVDLCEVANDITGTFAATDTAAGAFVRFLDTPGFTVNTVAGDVCATGATGVRTNNGDVNLVSTSGPITLTQLINTTPTPVAALTATVRLNSGGAVTQTPAGAGGVGAITALDLAVVAAGNVDLCEVANNVGTFAAKDTGAGAFIRFLDTPGFTVGMVAGDVCAAGASGVTTTKNALAPFTNDIDLVSTAGALTLDNPVNAGTGTVRLNSGAGVTQVAGGTITAANLAVVADGTIALCVVAGPNQVSGIVALDASGGPAASSVMFLDALSFTVGTVATDTCAAGATGVKSNNGTIDLVSTAGPLTLDNPVNAGTGTVRLNSGAGVTQVAGGTITAANLAVVADGTIALCVVAGPNQVSGIVALDASGGGTVMFLDAPAFTVGTVATDACAAGATGLTSTGNGNLTLETTTGDLTLNEPINAGTGIVALASGGTVTQLATAPITAGSLGILAADTIDLCSTNAANVVSLLAANDSGAGKAILFGDTVALTIGSVAPTSCFAGASGVTTTGNGNITLKNTTAGDLTINDPINAGTGIVALTSAGKVTQAVGGPITAGSLGILAGDTIDLRSTNAPNVVGLLAANDSGAGKAILFGDSVALTVGTVQAAPCFAGASGVTAIGNGAIILSSVAAVAVDAVVGGAGDSGTITINANTGGAGAGGFSQTAAGIILTTNASAAAVAINVNAAGGGTGGAAIGAAISSGAGGTITITTATGGNSSGGSITDTAAATLNAGTGTVALSTPTGGSSGIGTGAANLLTTAGTITAAAGSGGVSITNSTGASFTATATEAGNISLTTTVGTLAIGGATSTGTGAIQLTANGSGGAISEGSGGTLSTTGTLTTNSAAGTTLNNANTVTTFNATNTTSFNVSLTNTAATLSITGISNLAAGGDVTVNNTGAITVNGSVSASAAIAITASSNLTISQTGPVTTQGSTTLTGNGAITIDAVITGNGNSVFGGPGNDTITINVTGPAAVNALTLDGKAGSDRYVVNLTSNFGKVQTPVNISDSSPAGDFNQAIVNGNTTQETLNITNTSVLSTVNGGVANYTGLQHLTVNGEAGSDTFNVLSTSVGTMITGTGGNNVFVVSSKADGTGTLAGIQGVVSIDAGTGSNKLTVSESGSAVADNPILENTSNVVSAIMSNSNAGALFQPIIYTATGGTFGNGVIVDTGKGATDVSVMATQQGAPTTVNLNGVSNMVVVSSNSSGNGDLTGILNTLVVNVNATAGTSHLLVSEAGNMTTADHIIVEPNMIYSSDGKFPQIGYSSLSNASFNVEVRTPQASGNGVVVEGTSNKVGLTSIDTMGIRNAVIVSSIVSGTDNLLGIQGPVAVNAMNGTNLLEVSESGDTINSDLVYVTNSSIYSNKPGGFKAIGYQAFNNATFATGILVNGTSVNGDSYVVMSTLAGATTMVTAPGANSTLVVASTPAHFLPADPIATTAPALSVLGPLSFMAGAGANNELIVSDVGNPYPEDVAVTNKTISSATAFAQISYQGLNGATFGGGVTVATGTVNDLVMVLSTLASAPTTVDTGMGNNTITVSSNPSFAPQAGNTLDTTGMLSGQGSLHDIMAPLTIVAGTGYNSLWIGNGMASGDNVTLSSSSLKSANNVNFMPITFLGNFSTGDPLALFAGVTPNRTQFGMYVVLGRNQGGSMLTYTGQPAESSLYVDMGLGTAPDTATVSASAVSLVPPGFLVIDGDAGDFNTLQTIP